MTEDRDVVIVGAGIAGLVAADRLRDLQPVVLEAADRVGGRIWSQQRGDVALSVGAHMFPPPDSVIGTLVAEHGLELMPIPGSMLNVHYRGRLVRDSRPELLPFRLPLSLGGRVSFARAGLRVKRDGSAYMKLIERRPGDTEAAIRLRGLQHGGDRSFADFLGPLHPEAYEIFQALANRSTAEPEEISQSAMAALFGHVWDTGDLGRNLRGGSGRLPAAIADSLGDAVRLSTRVEEVRTDGAGVRVRFAGEGGSGEIRARAAIVTVPSPHVPSVVPDLPPAFAEALGRVTFGTLTVLSALLDDAEPMPWDDLYSILTPDKRFNMLFNHANFLQGASLPKTGSVIMVYGGGDRGRAYLERTDDDLREDYLADLYTIYPETRGRVVETMVSRWRDAGPYAGPGRWRAQAALEAGIADRIFFAGDWVSDFVSMETAAGTAVDAAAAARRAVGAVATAS
jgi:oxygen-dependent protoporphyrinogen oxidase